MSHLDFIARLAQPSNQRIVLLVLDGAGDLRSAEQPETALDVARLPNLDALAQRSALGRLLPVAPGVTPGSGPGHLSLFGYDPQDPTVDIGRGVLEALGLGLELHPTDVAARGNFATADTNGQLTDRRAGRIPTAECRRLCTKLQEALAADDELEIRVVAGEGHRFVLLLGGPELSAEILDTDPQRTGVAPLPASAARPAAEATAAAVRRIVHRMEEILAGEPQANRVLLRGFSQLPDLPSFSDLYGIRAGAFAGYPLYRGVATACGMQVVPCGKSFAEIVDVVTRHWQDFDYFFLHVKQTDQAGEDGDLDAKVKVLEQVDAGLPALMDLGPDVLAITADHSTPAPLKAHSWHPVPLLLYGPHCFVDSVDEFSEVAACGGHIGTLRSYELMGLLLANAGRLKKFGA